jgi:hypothetical protein
MQKVSAQPAKSRSTMTATNSTALASVATRSKPKLDGYGHSDEFYEQRLAEHAPYWEEHLHEPYHLMTILTTIMEGPKASGWAKRSAKTRTLSSEHRKLLSASRKQYWAKKKAQQALV